MVLGAGVEAASLEPPCLLEAVVGVVEEDQRVLPGQERPPVEVAEAAEEEVQLSEHQASRWSQGQQEVQEALGVRLVVVAEVLQGFAALGLPTSTKAFRPSHSEDAAVP